MKRIKHRDLTSEAVKLLKELIATPSVSRDEENVANGMHRFLYAKGLNTQKHGCNVWAICDDYKEEKPTILLNAHIDTVRPVDGWTHDPFTPELDADGDTIYGLGSNDDGASVVSLLEVFMQMCKEERQYNLIYLASCEEEVSGKGGIESVLPLLPHIDLGIVGEPTEMQPAIAEKGLMVIDATAHGKAGHAARNEGENAIYKALDDIRWISTHEFPKKTDLLGPVKMSVTIVNAGTQHNVVPDKCVFTIDVRSNECYTNEEIFEEIKRNIKSTPVARSFRLSSSGIDQNHPIVLRCKELGLMPFGSPTLSDQALMRFPSIKIGPGQSSRSHTADEFIRISEIDEAIDIYLSILRNLEI
jgi:acetylornithine deacetylase